MVSTLSDTEFSQNWLNQFENNMDRSCARQLLDSLKYISLRDFEIALTNLLTGLQNSLNSRIAVYPVCAPLPNGIIGQNLFNGNIANPNLQMQPRHAGRRKQYGSEDRVGHILERISAANRGNNGISTIEVCPNKKTLERQGIKNIVFVDDICGSGQRFFNFYKKEFPASLKRLLSIGEIRVWFICYGMTKAGKKFITTNLKYFKKNPTNIVTYFPILDFDNILTTEIRDLCFRYSRKVYGTESASLGYKNSIGGIVFEHGCPNNLPRILWDSKKQWNALFQNRAIPTELRPSFSEDSHIDFSEVLWGVNQQNLAIALLESIENKNFDINNRSIITLLGLINKGVREQDLATKMLIDISRCNDLINKLLSGNLIKYHDTQLKVTSLGNCILNNFKKKYTRFTPENNIAYTPENYYPSQCDGHPQFLVDDCS